MITAINVNKHIEVLAEGLRERSHVVPSGLV